MDDAEREFAFPHRSAIAEMHYCQVRGVAAAIDGFGLVHVWDVRPPEANFEIPGNGRVVESHHPVLMGFFEGRQLRVFERAAGTEVLSVQAHAEVTAAVIPEHQRLAAFSTVDGGVFRIFEFGAPERLFEHKAAVTRLHVRQSELYAAGLDGIASVYDLQQEAVVASIAHWGPVQGVEAVGPRLIASLTENGFLQFFDRETGRVIYFDHVGTAASAFTGSGNEALVVVKEPNRDQAAMVDIVTGEYVTDLPAAIEDVSKSLVSLDQTRALLVCAARPVQTLTGRTTAFAAQLSLVDLVTRQTLVQSEIVLTNEAIAESQGRRSDGEVRDWMNEASFSPDAALLVADSGELYLWDFSDDAPLRLFGGEDGDRVMQANFTQDGELIVARMAVGGRRIWDVSREEEADSTCVTRC